jgi:hypothetical protein
VNLCVLSLAVAQRFSSIVLPVSVSFDVEGQRTSKLLMSGPTFGLGCRGGSNKNLVAIITVDKPMRALVVSYGDIPFSLDHQHRSGARRGRSFREAPS